MSLTVCIVCLQTRRLPTFSEARKTHAMLTTLIASIENELDQRRATSDELVMRATAIVAHVGDDESEAVDPGLRTQLRLALAELNAG